MDGQKSFETPTEVYHYLDTAPAYRRIESVPEMIQFASETTIPQWIQEEIAPITGVIALGSVVNISESLIEDSDTDPRHMYQVTIQLSPVDQIEPNTMIAKATNALRDIIEPFSVYGVTIPKESTVELVIETIHDIDGDLVSEHETLTAVETVSENT